MIFFFKGFIVEMAFVCHQLLTIILLSIASRPVQDPFEKDLDQILFFQKDLDQILF